MVQESPETPQDRSKTPKMAPRRPKRPPRRPKKPPRGLPRGPREAKSVAILARAILNQAGLFHNRHSSFPVCRLHGLLNARCRALCQVALCVCRCSYQSRLQWFWACRFVEFWHAFDCDGIRDELRPCESGSLVGCWRDLCCNGARCGWICNHRSPRCCFNGFPPGRRQLFGEFPYESCGHGDCWTYHR